MANNSLEHDLKVLDLIEENPSISQREIATSAGMSVGKVNFVLNALVEKGLVKASNFKKSNNKMGYIYKLTPQGLAEKTQITLRFLKRKMDEHAMIEQQIEQLRAKLESAETQGKE